MNLEFTGLTGEIIECAIQEVSNSVLPKFSVSVVDFDSTGKC